MKRWRAYATLGEQKCAYLLFVILGGSFIVLRFNSGCCLASLSIQSAWLAIPSAYWSVVLIVVSSITLVRVRPLQRAERMFSGIIIRQAGRLTVGALAEVLKKVGHCESAQSEDRLRQLAACSAAVCVL